MTTTPEISATALPCVQCQYDLRATPVNARCPECGMAASATLAHQRGELFQPRQVFWLAGAFLCWTLALFIMTLNHLTPALLLLLNLDPDMRSFMANQLFSLLLPVLVLLILVGNSLLIRPLIARDPNRKRKYLLTTLRLFPLLYIGLFGLMLLQIGNMPDQDFMRLVITVWVLLNMGYLLLFTWRLRDLARTAPALQPSPLQRLLIRYGLITYGLLEFTVIFMSLFNKSASPLTPALGSYLLFSLFIACRLLLLILASLQFDRTYAFYHHCQTQWTASLPPKPEPHP